MLLPYEVREKAPSDRGDFEKMAPMRALERTRAFSEVERYFSEAFGLGATMVIPSNPRHGQ
jgi:hypothetical protein